MYLILTLSKPCLFKTLILVKTKKEMTTIRYYRLH